MNKISGILPSSPRIEAVDMRNERPLRPGAVSFGQPVTESTVRPSPVQSEIVSEISAEAAARELRIPGRKSDKNIVEELSSSFFLKNTDRNPGEKIAGVEGTTDYQSEGSQKRLSLYA